MSRNDTRRQRSRDELTRRTVLRKGALAAGGLSIGLGTSVGSATADQWDQRRDLTGSTEGPNPCTGEEYTFTSGTLLIDFDERSDQRGGVHVSITSVVRNGRAVGDETGLKYEVGQAFSQNGYVDADGKPYTFTASGHFTVASDGAAPDWRGDVTAHVTVNANGDLVIERTKQESDCRG